MRRLRIAVLALALTTLAAPASAFVVEVTTSISMEDIGDEAQLRDALQKTVDSVLSHAIAFRPTVVVLTHDLVRRGRLYFRLLVVDQDGERAVEELDFEREPEPTEVKL
jgi:hypothetical protein